jgi:ribonuclease D
MHQTSSDTRPVHWVDSERTLQDLWASLDRSDWLGFDTEFIGEKREIPLLCLLQIVNEEAVWLVDPIALPDWTQFGQYLSDPDKKKITHAGENDYRLMYELLDVLPVNTFDLQMAVGFTGMRVPSSLGSILQEVLGQSADKGYTVADWTVRPLPEKMRKYAIEDVRYLDHLYRRVMERLGALERTHWAEEEMRVWESGGFYRADPMRKLLQQKSIAAYSEQEKVFILRLAQWRIMEAEATGVKSEELLSSRQLLEIAKVIGSGSEALFRNRVLPKSFLRKNKETLLDMYARPAEEQELRELYHYAPKESVDPAVESRTQLVLHLLQMYCIEQNLSIDLLLPGSESKKYRIIADYRYEGLYEGWRREFLPDVWRELLENRSQLCLSMQHSGVLLTHT